VVESKAFVFDLKTSKYEGANPDVELMTLADGVEFETRYVNVKGKDGVLVPVRLVYKKDLVFDGTAASLISTYGGFAVNGELYPRFSALNLEFLKRGGVSVNPGVRGGFEFGEDWHQMGMREKKQNVLDDLNAVAEMLIAEGISPAKKIISIGWSNGGMVVAAAALQRPELYGLVIPGNGVQDYINSQRLDPRYQGWKHEFGDATTKDLEFMLAVAPLELAQKESGEVGPVFLLMTGANDSRVNAAHSYKLTQAYQDNSKNGPQMRLMAITNSGHWMSSWTYQNIIAWRSNSVIWSYIFGAAEMKP
jgi:prolyl oligopeptidase